MNWGWSWTGKLRQDKQDKGADFAVLVVDDIIDGDGEAQ